MGLVVRELVNPRAARVLLALTVVTSLVLCSVPLFGVLGVESAFVLGLLLPLFTALHVERLERESVQGLGKSAWARLQRAAAVAVLHSAVACALLTLNALWVRQCEPLMGLTYLALGPLCGSLLAGVIAVPAVHLSQRTWLRRLLAIAAPVLGLASFAYGFYASPAIVAYGHFFGYFPGSFYDALIDFPYPLLWLRLGSTLLLLAVLLGTHLMLSPLPRGRWTLATRVAMLAITLGLALRVQLLGPELGFAVSESHLRTTLGTTLRSRRCVIIAPREYAERYRFAQDCDVRVEQLERYLGLRQPTRVTVYLFRSAYEKRQLIGAAGTNVAKPWRNEIYLQLSDYPHPVMPHELAHVVLGQVGIGPFRISGSLGGLWPNPGIIEGAAVAADFHSRSDLTPHQWARAAVDNDRAPSLSQLFGAGFFAQQASLSYTIAGSFLRHIVDTRGRSALLHIYREGDVASALGTSLPALEEAYHAFLQTVPLPPDAAALARERFSGTSVLSAICPHRVAHLERALSADMRSGDLENAIKQCNALLEVDPDDTEAAATRVTAVARAGHLGEASTQLARLAQHASSALVAKTRQDVADALVAAGQLEEADALYRALMYAPHTAGTLRQLQVKRIALQGPPAERQLLFSLLTPPPGQEVDPGLAVYLTRELRALRSDGLPYYLEARQLYFFDHYGKAASLLDEAIDRGLPTPEILDEALRLQALCRLAQGDLNRAETLYRKRLDDERPAVRLTAQDALQRIRILRRHRASGA